MRVAFRVDASIQIGTGHVMRCLTLADALAAKGVDCHFICREHSGHLIEVIKRKGFAVHTLPVVATKKFGNKPLPHAEWLGASQEQDVAACFTLLDELRPEWLVVDHYALDIFWESQLKPNFNRLMVIDDLADREHHCGLLLDQTFGRLADDYRDLVPLSAQLLCGSNYALLRPEFAIFRQTSLERRSKAVLHRLLVNLGGVDKDNATTRVLKSLRECELPGDCKITIVMGATAPFLQDVQTVAQTLPWSTDVLVSVDNMAELMAESDLAIGAAGATSWERCCLGLPSVLLVLAENQKQVAYGLKKAGAAYVVSMDSTFDHALQDAVMRLARSPELLRLMARSAMDIVDGYGAAKVIEKMEL